MKTYSATKRILVTGGAGFLDSRLIDRVAFPLYVEVAQPFNLACPASPVHCQHDPVQAARTSVTGTITMQGLAKRFKVPIFQASTSEVYFDGLLGAAWKCGFRH